MVKLAVSVDELLALSKKYSTIIRASKASNMGGQLLGGLAEHGGKRFGFLSLGKGWTKSFIPKREAFIGKSHRATNVIGLGHELSELHAMRKYPLNRAYREFYGHHSPAAMLGEHNIITKLTGPGAEVAKRAVINSRNVVGGEASNLKLYLGSKFEFGKSPRLSRHAIKRISNMPDKGIFSASDKIKEILQRAAR